MYLVDYMLITVIYICGFFQKICNPFDLVLCQKKISILFLQMKTILTEFWLLTELNINFNNHN